MVMNLTSIHGDSGLIPGLPQWLKDRHGYSCGVGWQLQLNSTASLGTSICYGCGPKKTKKKKRKKEKKKKKKRPQLGTMRLQVQSLASLSRLRT